MSNDRRKMTGLCLALGMALGCLAHGAETVEDLRTELAGLKFDAPVRIDGKPVKVAQQGATVVLSGAADVPPEPEPLPPVVSKGPEGYGLMQQGARQSVLTDAQINHPKVTFLVPRDRWKFMEPQDDRFDFSYLAAQIRRYRKAGKPYLAPVMTGRDSTPSWVAGPRYQNTLAPWAPAIAAEYREFITALANHSVDGVKVKDDPLLVGVWITGATVPSQELHLNGMDKAPGYSPAGIVANYKGCIDAVKAAFPGKAGILSISGQTPVQAYQPQIIAHMKSAFGKDLARFQHNSLGTQTNVNATHHRILLGLHREGYKVGAEMVSGGQTAGLSKFPERSYAVLYPGDERNVK